MKFSISELIAKITGLESRIAAADKAELTAIKAQVDDALTEVQASLDTVQAEVTRLNIELATAAGTITEEKAARTALVTKLDAACAALKVEGIAALTPEAKIEALQNATNNAIAKTGVNLENLPAQGAGKAEDIKKPGEGLTGIKRVIAIEKAEAEAKLKRN